MLPETPVLMLLSLLLMLAVVFDMRERRIPNWLSLGGWVAAITVHGVLGGWAGMVGSGEGLLLLLGLTFPLFALGWFGAGDVKLIAAVGGLVGIGLAWQVLLGILLAGAVPALAVLARKGVMGETLQRYQAMVGLSVVASRPTYVEPGEAQQQLTVPYAVAVAIGTSVVLLLRWRYG